MQKDSEKIFSRFAFNHVIPATTTTKQTKTDTCILFSLSLPHASISWRKCSTEVQCWYKQRQKLKIKNKTKKTDSSTLYSSTFTADLSFVKAPNMPSATKRGDLQLSCPFFFFFYLLYTRGLALFYSLPPTPTHLFLHQLPKLFFQSSHDTSCSTFTTVGPHTRDGEHLQTHSCFLSATRACFQTCETMSSAWTPSVWD